MEALEDLLVILVALLVGLLQGLLQQLHEKCSKEEDLCWDLPRKEGVALSKNQHKPGARKRSFYQILFYVFSSSVLHRRGSNRRSYILIKQDVFSRALSKNKERVVFLEHICFSL
jgi:hypothetical protein